MFVSLAGYIYVSWGSGGQLVRPREVAPTAGGQSWVRRAAAPAASRRDAAINCSRSVRRFRQQAAGSSPRSPTGHAQVAGAAFPYPNPSSINFPIKLPKHRMRYIPPLISPSQPLFPSLQTPPVLSTPPLPSYTPPFPSTPPSAPMAAPANSSCFHARAAASQTSSLRLAVSSLSRRCPNPKPYPHWPADFPVFPLLQRGHQGLRRAQGADQARWARADQTCSRCRAERSVFDFFYFSGWGCWAGSSESSCPNVSAGFYTAVNRRISLGWVCADPCVCIGTWSFFWLGAVRSGWGNEILRHDMMRYCYYMPILKVCLLLHFRWLLCLTVLLQCIFGCGSFLGNASAYVSLQTVLLITLSNHSPYTWRANLSSLMLCNEYSKDFMLVTT